MINMLPHLSFPLAPSSFSGADDSKLSAESNADQLAWQREMERAQMNGWLNNPLTGGPRQAPDLSESGGGRAGPDTMKPSSASSAFSAAHVSLPAALLTARESAPAAPSLRPENAGGGDGADVRMIGEGLPQRLTARIGQFFSTQAGRDSEAGSHTTAVKAASEGELSSVDGGVASSPRISLELVGDDARLWLGISAGDDLSQADLARIVSEARSMLAEEGVRLQEVMCNGKRLQTALEDVAAAEGKQDPSLTGSSDTGAASGGVPFYSYFETQQET